MFYRKTNNPVPDIMLSLGDDIKTAAEINNRTVRNFLCIHCKKGNDAVLIKEIMSGKISFCKIKSDHDKLLKVDIGIDNRKISFISRPKEYKMITGTTSYHQSPHWI